jgi:hypothetical protein
MATIADIRRGDRFTWGGASYLAVDDCRPLGDAAFGFGRDFGNITYIRAAGLKRNADGVYDLEMRIPQASAVRLTASVEIHEREVRIHHVSDDVREGTPRFQIMSNLDYIVHSRDVARREAGDLDEQRDIVIRQALSAGVSVADLVERTGLTRARIYQIRDGRR